MTSSAIGTTVSPSSRFFKSINIVFAILHFILLVTSVVFIGINIPLQSLYALETIGNNTIEVHPIVLSTVICFLSIVFHIIYECMAESIVVHSIQHFKTNHSRWLYHMFTDSLSMVTLVLFFKPKRLDTLVLVFLIYTAILALNYYYDMYLVDNKVMGCFNPSISPHTFSHSLFVLFAGFLVSYALQRLDNENIVQLIMSIIVIVLAYTMFYIQKIHIYVMGPSSSSTVDNGEEEKSDGMTTIKMNDDDDQSASTRSEFEKNELVLNEEIRMDNKAIYFELWYYTASFLIHALVTIMSIDSIVKLSDGLVGSDSDDSS